MQRSVNKTKNLIKQQYFDADYDCKYIRIKTNSNNDLPLNKPLLMFYVVILFRSVFEDDGTYYPQVFLEKRLVWITLILLTNKERHIFPVKYET